MQFVYILIGMLMAIYGAMDKHFHFEEQLNKVLGVSEETAEDREKAALHRLRDEARDTHAEFLQALESPAGKTNFMVLYPYVADDGKTIEYVWLYHVQIERGGYGEAEGPQCTGVVDDAPDTVSWMEDNTRYIFYPRHLADWLYVDNEGFVVGGRWVIDHVRGLNEQERREYCERTGFKIRPEMLN